MNGIKIKLEKSWKDALRAELQTPEMAKLWSFVENEYAGRKPIYPPKHEIFAALDRTPFDRVKVVVIGQDPYHRPAQANGLCFSVRKGEKLPPSLRNIFEELRREFDYEIPTSGDLSEWAKQGVLLLNSALTVEERRPGSHRSKWKHFTDKIIEKLAAKPEPLVFILWGRDAQRKAAQIDTGKHLVLESAHPSPFSCRDFFDKDHFKKANEYLRKNKQEPINWQL
ncbi:MAG TPA: uracil-DNA glycosylase [Candidatus Sulfotelmatobacter sp.]|jgi:uracil-DNA glycosylase